MEEMTMAQRVDQTMNLLITIGEMLQNVSPKDISSETILAAARALTDNARRILNEEV